MKSEWTVATLKEHFDALIAALLAASRERTEETQRQKVLDDAALERRLELLNDLRSRVLTREEYNTAHDALDEKLSTAIKAVEDRLTVLTDRFNTEVSGRRQGGNALWGYALGALTLISLVINAYFLARGH